MKKRVTLPWSAAAWRQSTYEPRVRKVHGPIGEQLWPDHVPDMGTCRGCGHHVCSCGRQSYALTAEWLREHPPLPKPEPREYNFGACDIPIVVDPRLRPGEAWLLPVPPNPGPAGPVSDVGRLATELNISTRNPHQAEVDDRHQNARLGGQSMVTCFTYCLCQMCRGRQAHPAERR